MVQTYRIGFGSAWHRVHYGGAHSLLQFQCVAHGADVLHGVGSGWRNDVRQQHTFACSVQRIVLTSCMEVGSAWRRVRLARARSFLQGIVHGVGLEIGTAVDSMSSDRRERAAGRERCMRAQNSA